MAKKITVPMTEDLTLCFNFEEKILSIESNNWLTVTKKKEGNNQIYKIDDPKSVKPNKKVKPSKAETQFEKFVQTFELLQQMDTFTEGVSFQTIKQAVTTRGIAKEIGEINNLINDAISKDVIEGANKYGVYKLKI